MPRYPKIVFPENFETIWLIIPKAGKIKIYTSGCPKNQNKCWYNTGSPPPAGSKKVVLKLRSVNNIVIPPAKTGIDNNNKKAVISIDHTTKGNLCIDIPGALILKIVVIKLIDPKIDETPDKCRLKIAKSTAGPEWLWIPLKGGYTVQPVPGPASVKAEDNNNKIDGGNNQKEILFILGKAMSGAPIIIGTNQLPKPPIKIGITIKKYL